MKKIILAVAVMSTAFLFSCKSGGSDPKAVLTSFFEALSKKDIAAARKLATEDSKSMLDMVEMGMKMSNDTKETEKYDKNNMEFGDVKIDGDKATVPVKEKKSGETLNYSLKKVNGEWKVAFDKSSVMSMGMEKLNEKGVDAGAEVNKAMDELKDVNADSLKAGLEEATKALDSMSKK
ncbi:MAG: DUF4878 domain-containing protein [Ferruginibacter sp.]|jgi:hypothetical protein